jgi:L-fuculose-phosphate aldolase
VAGSRKRTSEILMHLEIYKARADVDCVVHSHPPHATAFAVAGIELPTCIHPEAEVFLGAVKMAQYVTPGDKRLGESVLPYVKDHNTLLLQNHGVVTWGKGLETTYYQLEIVDAYSRILMLANSLGSIKPLEPQQMKELLDLKSKFGLKDARAGEGAEALVCQSDFISRVSEIATKGRMMTDGGTVPAPMTAQAASCPAETKDSAMQQMISSLTPAQYGPAEVEQLVQTITDQIMQAVA